MVRRVTGLAAVLAGAVGLAAAAGQPADKVKAKKALQEVQDFIGAWNLEGTRKVGAKTEAWKERVSWAWKFKGDDAWIVVEFEKGKHFSKGELRYLVDKKKYQLALTPPGKAEADVYEGDYARGALRLDRKDPKTGDVYRLTMNTAAEGVRFILRFEKQDGGKGLFASVYQMAGTKEGESLAGVSKKPECIVTGGAASIKVSYMGKDYYVCCSGCRDAFNENPEKILKAAKK
jgi:YHS domain-containing protein